jgi:cytochrome c oxidase accessory protein FixG
MALQHLHRQDEEPGTGIPFYAPHEKVYPKSVHGTMRRIKWAVLIACLSLYYIGPWLRWPRGAGRPDQALLIDMPARRAYFFGLEIWPQEIYYLAGLLILAAIGLFLVTSLFGRVWCGYTCPQTVWTDLFLWAERLVEGDRTQRIRLDQQPLSPGKILRKLAKHAIWLVIAAATGGAWIMYFNDAPTLIRDLFTLDASRAQYFFFGLFTATTYLLAGWAREQVCTYMCPWPRFQSAMIDEETFAVTYRDWRGEPRAKHKKGEDWQGRGDCVDCRACVAVCPTGIDIRDGLQLECIGCGLCIDACDDIMDRVGRPRGLIAFDTYANRVAAQRGEKPKRRYVRPRTIAYVFFLGAIGALMLYGLAQRSSFAVTLLADRSPLFVRLSDGSIRDGYTLKIENRSGTTREFAVTLADLPGAELRIAESDAKATPGTQGLTLTVESDSVGTYRALVQAARSEQAERPFAFEVRETQSGEVHRHAATFRGPGQ